MKEGEILRSSQAAYLASCPVVSDLLPKGESEAGAPVGAQNRQMQGPDRFIRSDLRLVLGVVVLLLGVAILIADSVSAPASFTLEGWLYMAGELISAVGLLLAASAIGSRGSRLSIGLSAIVPGTFAAAMARTIIEFFQPEGQEWDARANFRFVWNLVASLGVLWALVGPFLVYRVRMGLLTSRPEPSVSTKPSETQERAMARLTFWLVVGTFAVAVSGLAAPLIASIFSK